MKVNGQGKSLQSMKPQQATPAKIMIAGRDLYLRCKCTGPDISLCCNLTFIHRNSRRARQINCREVDLVDSGWHPNFCSLQQSGEDLLLPVWLT